MLHIVNGDTVAEKLRQGIVQGDTLVWREIYSEGPVFLDTFNPSSRSARATDLEKTMGIPSEEYINGCESQEQKLRQFNNYDEIILWFEHDLFDQTMLCCLLHWFSKQKLGRTKLNLLCIGSFPGIEPFRGLGQLSIEQVRTLSGTWRLIDRKELESGSAYWEAFTSSDPRHLAQLLQADSSVLPFAKDAFHFHLSRFPSVRNGLGIVEQTALELIGNNVNKPFELFRSVGDKLHWFGMGDLQFWVILRQMAEGSHPLIDFEGTDTVIPGYSKSSPEFQHCQIQLTDTGRRVRDGQEDWASIHEMDCWLGGVHLQGNKPLFRWDGQKQSIVLQD